MVENTGQYVSRWTHITLHRFIHHNDFTFAVIEAVWTKNDIHSPQLQNLRRELTPGQSYDLHRWQVIGVTTATAVLEAMCQVTGVGQGDVSAKSSSQHSRQSRTSAKLQRKIIFVNTFPNMVNNEKPRKETGGEWDEDAAMYVWSQEER